MLGQKIMDPHKIESSIGEISGLGLLPIGTVMEKTKTTQYTNILKNTGNSILEGAEGIAVKGYMKSIRDTAVWKVLFLKENLRNRQSGMYFQCTNVKVWLRITL